MPKGVFERWTRQLVRRGIQEGLIEGSDVWLSIAALVWLFRFLSRRPPPQVSVARLRVGESLLVSNVPPIPRSRRARKKAAKRKARAEDDRAKREARRAAQQAKRESSRRHMREVAKAAEAQALADAKQARRAARNKAKQRSKVGEGQPGRERSEEDGGESE